MELKDLALLITALIGVCTLAWTVYNGLTSRKVEESKQHTLTQDNKEERTLKYAFELMDDLRDEVKRLRDAAQECQTVIRNYEEIGKQDRARIEALEKWVRERNNG